jgi:hypothetical protein
MGDYDEHTYALRINSIASQHLFSITYQTGNLLHTPHISPEQPPDVAA